MSKNYTVDIQPLSDGSYVATVIGPGTFRKPRKDLSSHSMKELSTKVGDALVEMEKTRRIQVGN